MKTENLEVTKQRIGTIQFESNPLQKERVYQEFCKKVLNNEFTTEFKVTQGRGPQSFRELENTRDIYKDCRKEPDLYIDSEDSAIALEVKLDPNNPGGLGKAIWYKEMGFDTGLVTTDIPDQWFLKSCLRVEVPVTVIETEPDYSSSLQDYRILHFNQFESSKSFEPEKVYKDVTSMQYIEYHKNRADEWKDEAQKKQIIKEDIHTVDRLLSETVEILGSDIDITRSNLPVVLHSLVLKLIEQKSVDDMKEEEREDYIIAQELMQEAADNLKALHSILYDYGLTYGEFTFDIDEDSINKIVRE
jgi:hypothetical protein